MAVRRPLAQVSDGQSTTDAMNLTEKGIPLLTERL